MWGDCNYMSFNMEFGNKVELFVLLGVIKGEICMWILFVMIDFVVIDMLLVYGRMNWDKVICIFLCLKNFVCFYLGFDWFLVLF